MTGARRAATIAFAAGALAATGAAAESVTPVGLRGLTQVQSADAAGQGALEAGLFLMGDRRSADSLAVTFGVAHLVAGYGFSPYFETAVALPVRGWRGSGGVPESALGFGDLLAGAKLQLPVPWKTLRLGGSIAASFPTGSASRGLTSDRTDLEARGLVTLDFTRSERFLPTRLHANAGWRWNRNETVGTGLAPLADPRAGGFWPPAYPPVPAGADPSGNDVLVLRAGVEFTTRILALFTELTWDAYPHLDSTAARDAPIFLTQGALLKLRNGINLKLAADVALQRDDPPPVLPDLPSWRFTLGVTWRSVLTLGDGDHDGISKAQDRCPDAAEDFDGFADEDGCPDLDNDADGIPDRVDLAPDLREDFDGFEDQDGRPDRDNDGDGIPDDQDACPNGAEDFDGDRDTDGCPE